MACEDYPCCGHEAGDCPTVDEKGRERWTCTECGRRLPLNSPSSICKRCLRRLDRRGSEGFDDYGMFEGG
jgi:ribosomal protein S14